MRVLEPEPIASLDDHLAVGGGRGVDAAKQLAPDEIVTLVDAAGLRGRGGAGFPTGKKWRTIAAYEAARPSTVVVNAAEGEPGSFKDRALLRANPYRVLEGALIAARAVDAPRVVVALKHTFLAEIARVRRAAAEITAAGWAPDVEIDVVEGPTAYLFGEETALLEVVDGRAPLPRLAPPWRRGIADVGSAPDFPAGSDLGVVGGSTDVPPALANNTETLANVPGILAEGVDWFRSVGTEGSPGTVVCTVTGATRRHGVAEVPMGTPLLEVLERVGGGAEDGHDLIAVLSGVANPIVPADDFGTGLGYDELRAVGSGLGAAGFIAFDDRDDLVAVAHGVARFLSVESCGQCTPCKQDSAAAEALLLGIRRSDADPGDLGRLEDRLLAVTDGARCFLAHQTQQVVGSILQRCPDEVERHLSGDLGPSEPYLIAPIVDLAEGRAVLDEHQWEKQPDWTYGEHDSGKVPADLYG